MNNNDSESKVPDIPDIEELKKGMILPEITMKKGTLRKKMVDENGRFYDVSEEIDIPVFTSKKPKETIE